MERGEMLDKHKIIMKSTAQSLKPEVNPLFTTQRVNGYDLVFNAEYQTKYGFIGDRTRTYQVPLGLGTSITASYFRISTEY